MMPFPGLIVWVLAAFWSVLLSSAGDVVSTSKAVSTNSTSGGNSTTHAHGPGPNLSVDSSMIQRALYVLIGCTMIGVLYFLIRAVRLKRPGYKKKKYGLLSNMEETEMDGGESEEDNTLYEARALQR